MKIRNVGCTSRFIVCSEVDGGKTKRIQTPECLLEYWREQIETQPDHEPDKENLVVVLLNIRMEAFAWNRVSVGTIDHAPGHPREIFRPVIVGGAHSFVLMHNHPGGDPSPSKSDFQFTDTIRRASEFMALELRDHIVVGESRGSDFLYVSFASGNWGQDDGFIEPLRYASQRPRAAKRDTAFACG